MLLPNKVIYIPIWLDLLSIYDKKDKKKIKNLHSNMVRFIILDFTYEKEKI